VLQDRVEEAFAGLLACRPEERRARLAALRGVDTDLWAEVESLLGVATKARGFLSIAPVPPAETFEPEPLLGERLGPYQIVGELGDGGMSTVFLGERADGQYRQQVAIKLFRYHQGTSSLRSRFDIERHILATLEHPNIARLLDGGTCANGRPYLVMEYVRGVAIDSYCHTRWLPLAAILELFCTVCHAMQYAHQNLVVHRDLKPGNILVTEEGVPKLLDFGIAKLLAPLPMGTEAPVTLAGNVLMTPEFAAPEQVGDAPITTATDVYALGVILYNLLTGQRPYEVGGDLATITEQALPPRRAKQGHPWPWLSSPFVASTRTRHRERSHPPCSHGRISAAASGVMSQRRARRTAAHAFAQRAVGPQCPPGRE
jgi:eukaryotic-like serine/threonine-protein kinase